MADKDGNVVKMDTPQYVSMCQKILDNRIWYMKVQLEAISVSHDKFLSLGDHAFHLRLLLRTYRSSSELPTR